MFGGETYVEELDGDRLRKQLRSVYELMHDGCWRSLKDIAKKTGHPEASISARLRDLRKQKFGGHIVERERMSKGLFKYRLILKAD